MKFLSTQIVSFSNSTPQDSNAVGQWFSFDKDAWLYLILIVVFLVFFIWNSSRLKKNRNRRSSQNFRNRYYEKRKDNK